jgi:hypothetical protein
MTKRFLGFIIGEANLLELVLVVCGGVARVTDDALALDTEILSKLLVINTYEGCDFAAVNSDTIVRVGRFSLVVLF